MSRRFGCFHDGYSDSVEVCVMCHPSEKAVVPGYARAYTAAARDGTERRGQSPLTSVTFSASDLGVAAGSLGPRLVGLRKRGVLLDAVLRGSDGDVRAHRVVLAAASPFFCRRLDAAVAARSSDAAIVHMSSFSANLLESLAKLVYGEDVVLPNFLGDRFRRLLRECDLLAHAPPSSRNVVTADGRTDGGGGGGDADDDDGVILIDDDDEDEPAAKKPRRCDDDGNAPDVVTNDETICLGSSDDEDDGAAVGVASVGTEGNREPEAVREVTAAGGAGDGDGGEDDDEVVDVDGVGSGPLEPAGPPSDGPASDPAEQPLLLSDSESASDGEDGGDQEEGEVPPKCVIPKGILPETVRRFHKCVFMGNLNLRGIAGRQSWVDILQDDEPESAEDISRGTAVRYFCALCDFVKDSAAAAELHTRLHRRPPEHPCSFCPLRFFRSSVLEVHVQECHPGRFAGGAT